MHKVSDEFRYDFPPNTLIPRVLGGSKPLLNKEGKRVDGRDPLQLRPIFMRTGVISQASGSSYVEMNKQSKSDYAEEALLECDFKYASFAKSGERVEYLVSDEEKSNAMKIKQALTKAIQLEHFPKSVIEINVLVLEGDGGELSASIVAASLAVANAKILLNDLVASCNAAMIDGAIVLDPTASEGKNVQSSIMISMTAVLDELTEIVQTGKMAPAECVSLADLCVEGCREIGKLMRQHLLDSANEEIEREKTKWRGVKKENEEEAMDLS